MSDHPSSPQATVDDAFAVLEELATVLESASECSGRTTALAAWRATNADRLTALTARIRQFTLPELQPVIVETRARHPRAGVAIELAMGCSEDPAFVAEWSAVSALLGG